MCLGPKPGWHFSVYDMAEVKADSKGSQAGKDLGMFP